VTNDDGVSSPGLVAAVSAALGLGSVLVAAPTEQQTARGRSLIGDRNDYFHPREFVVDGEDVPCYHIDASPALVVRHALAVLCADRTPDLVLSGINYGENIGSNIMISGTVGAALQAAASGIPAIAASRQTEIEHHFEYGELDWTDAARVTRGWVERLVGLSGDPEGPVALPFDVLKVDVPDPCPPGTEERITRLSRKQYFHSTLENPQLDSRPSDSVTGIHVSWDELSREDDIYALAVDRVVSVTPLTLDCTGEFDRTWELFGARRSVADGMHRFGQ
jgi:5'-nucleotidase